MMEFFVTFMAPAVSKSKNTTDILPKAKHHSWRAVPVEETVFPSKYPVWEDPPDANDTQLDITM